MNLNRPNLEFAAEGSTYVPDFINDQRSAALRAGLRQRGRVYSRFPQTYPGLTHLG